jgi:hypothetical protein
LGELRYWGSQIAEEINKVAPSFIRRTTSPMGEEIQKYKRDIRDLRDILSKEQFESPAKPERSGWVKLLGYTREGEIDVLSAFLFGGKSSPDFEKVKEKVAAMTENERKEMYRRILSQRALGKFNPRREDVRFKKVPRAFENSKYLFEMWARGGDYRDLQRHRMLTQERQNFTTRWGYDLENEVLASPFADKIGTVLKMASAFYESVVVEHPDAAQNIVPFAYIQHWYINLTAREIYYMGELRTGPQGRTHYRKLVLEEVRQVMEVHPNLFQGIMVDWNDYSLSRRESEKWTDKKRRELGV